MLEPQRSRWQYQWRNASVAGEMNLARVRTTGKKQQLPSSMTFSVTEGTSSSLRDVLKHSHKCVQMLRFSWLQMCSSWQPRQVVTPPVPHNQGCHSWARHLGPLYICKRLQWESEADPQTCGLTKGLSTKQNPIHWSHVCLGCHVL